MPRLPPDVSPSTDGIRNYLQEALPDAKISYVVAHTDYEPLLLLQTRQVLAAFAFASVDAAASYDALYAGFKNHYAAQQGRWDAMDVAFVFCLRRDLPNLYLFCSQVETDVYFCRKFVVPLGPDVAASLARLPFLPLAPLDGRPIRPPSAQTFLRQCNVPTELARFIVVQGERSPEGIVEDCIIGKFGEPVELLHGVHLQIAQSERAVNTVRLSSVTIENFRAYRKRQTFDLGDAVTVLYGPNGFGKTSFFDAVDFAVTGGVGRNSTSNTIAFAKTAQHLDSSGEESVVSISFVAGGAVRTIRRSVGDPKQALLDEQHADRKTVLTQLTGGGAPVADRVENLVNLFRATHLFSQEQQELTRDFQPNCQLSAEIVSRMLAFEDYVSALNKSAGVEEVLRATMSSAQSEILRLSDQITVDSAELERLGRAAKAHANVEALDSEIAALKSKVERIGITVQSNGHDALTIRGWRAALEARHADSDSRRNRLSNLAKEVATLSRLRPELAAFQEQVAQREQVLNAVEEKRTDTEAKLHQVEQHLAEANTKAVESVARAALYEWAFSTKPMYARHIDEERILVENLRQTTESLSQLHGGAQRAADALRTAETNSVSSAERANARLAQLHSLQSLSAVVAAWEVNAELLNAIGESEPTLASTVEAQRVEERELRDQLATVMGEVERTERAIAEAERGQSELKNLLSQLQRHVGSGTCPLCGEDHGSTEELVRRIQSHVAGDSASGARTQLSSLRQRLGGLTEQLANSLQMQQVANAKLTELRGERTRLEDEIVRFVNDATGHGVILTASTPTPTEQLHGRLQQAEQDVAELRQQGAVAEAALDGAVQALEKAKALAMAKEVEVANLKDALERVQYTIGQLRNDRRQAQISLDVATEQLEELRHQNEEQLRTCKEQASEAQAEATQKRMELGLIRQEAGSLKSQMAGLRSQVASLHQAISQSVAGLSELKLPPDTSEDELLEMATQEAQMQAQLLALRDMALSIELAIDTATTAAALMQLQSNLKEKEKAVVVAQQKCKKYEPWITYFSRLSRLLSSQQNKATSQFTQEYGPRASVIQRRLRSVYGFDDVEIHSRDGMIIVRVKRNGETLRPTDYFSQSQQQTLLLGLFLTASSSQTWSAFSPVFLDDPVTHFDDLNTYALLDLIVGLLESGIEARQFIISTCDEKLLNLARQKFRHFGGAAKFYRFSAISEQGPVVHEIPVQ